MTFIILHEKKSEMEKLFIVLHITKLLLVATDDISQMAFILEPRALAERRDGSATMGDIGWRKNYCFLEQEKLFSTSKGTSEGGLVHCT